MNSLRVFVSLVSLALAAVAPAQVRLQIGGQIGNLMYEPKLYDGLMIATALEPAVGHPLPGHPYYASQRVRVEGSAAYFPGMVVNLFYETVPVGSLPHYTHPIAAGEPVPYGTIPMGMRALVLARTARGGTLLTMGPGLIDPKGDEVPLGDTTPAALSLMFFRTSQQRLAADSEPRWRLLESLAAAIPHTDDANARNIAEEFGATPFRQRFQAYGGPDDRFSKMLTDAVAADTPYHRALVDYALNQGAYWGSADRFWRDVRAAADDPNAFPTGMPILPFWEDSANNFSLPKEFRHDPDLTGDQVLSLLGRAKSPAIIETFLGKLQEKPSDGAVRVLAKFLDHPDPRVRRAMVERLAAWNGMAAPGRVFSRPDDAGVDHYVAPPDLAPAVAFWKGKLGLP